MSKLVPDENLLPVLCADTWGLQTLHVDQVAKLLVCSDATVRARARELGGVKFGVDWIFSVDALRQRLFELGLESARAPAKQPSPTARAGECRQQASGPTSSAAGAAHPGPGAAAIFTAGSRKEVTDPNVQTDPTSTLVLVHAVAQLAALLPSEGNDKRTALQAIVEAINTWRHGQADEASVRAQVAGIARRAFNADPDMNLPECWMLDLVGSILGSCTAIDFIEGTTDLEAIARSEVAAMLAAQLVAQSLEVARRRPDALPLGVSANLYRVVADDVARRIEAAGRVGIGQAFGGMGPLQ